MRTNIIEVAEKLLARHKIRGFILPANSGTTARAFMERFGPDYQYIAIGNPCSSHEKDLFFTAE